MNDESVPGLVDTADSLAPIGAFDLLLAADSEVAARDSEDDAALRPFDFSGPPGSTEAALRSPSTGGPNVGLAPRVHEVLPTTDVIDWVALALAVVAPPVGVLAAIAAIVLGNRKRGFPATVAKVAVVVGAVLTVALLVAVFVLSAAEKQKAAHDAIVASSVQFCTQLEASGRLSSPTYGFPSSEDTIPGSISAIQKDEDFWTGLVKVAPKGIQAGTKLMATTAGGILNSVTSSRVVDDANNATVMQQAVTDSGINAWVSSYCG
ncbi:MAG: hypothetical protein QOC80_2163 [Frankiaceae bacterium]|nr:hypothetical protein [Frankiaceae bacterium]